VLLRPAAIAVASTEPDPNGIAASVTLGRAAAAPTAIYLRFDPTWRERGQVLSGFLLFETQPGARSSEDVPLEVWRARGDFAGESLKWSQQPGFAPPSARGIGRSAPPLPVRIDVTELLRFFSEHPTQDHGFLVRAESVVEHGLTLSTGTDGGLPPRLDVYLSE
jgi:hypothetical protein